MGPAKRFLEYAAAFEQTFVDDDWTQLEPYFTADAIYVVTGEAPLVSCLRRRLTTWPLGPYELPLLLRPMLSGDDPWRNRNRREKHDVTVARR
jgi:hypothetical protein